MRSARILLMSFFLMMMTLPVYYAQAGIVPCGGTGQKPCEICDLAKGIDNAVRFITSLVAIVAVVIIVVAGIVYIVSAGNQGMITTAKAAMKNALIGVIVVLSAFVLIHFVLRAIAVKDTGNLGGTGTNAWSFSCDGGYSTGGGF